MNEQNSYRVSYLVDNSPEEVFDAINNVRGWWSQAIEGDTDRLGAEFHYHYQDVHRSSFKITEFLPGKKVVWHVLDNYFNFIKDKNEWIGTDVVFEIERKGEEFDRIVMDHLVVAGMRGQLGKYDSQKIQHLLMRDERYAG